MLNGSIKPRQPLLPGFCEYKKLCREGNKMMSDDELFIKEFPDDMPIMEVINKFESMEESITKQKITFALLRLSCNFVF